MDTIGGKDRFIEVNKEAERVLQQSNHQPQIQSEELSRLTSDDWVISKSASRVTSSGSVSVENDILRLKTPEDGSYFDVSKKVDLDLSQKNIYFKIKVDQMNSLQGIDVSLSNDDWKKEATFNVEKIINYQGVLREGEWIQFGASKGELRKSVQGSWLIASWEKSGSTFDWSKVDGIRFIAKSKEGDHSDISIRDFILVPDQKDARVVVIFDDGWSSVMDAAELMRKYGMKGSTGIITSSVGKKGYMTLEELKRLQNEYGWSIANHSDLHKNAVIEYFRNNDLDGFENDTQNALQYLIQNDINSAPNWYIYPDGSTNEAVKEIIGKYYKFARATTIVLQPFPFPDPLEVGVFQVYSDRAIVSDIQSAVKDAKKYHQTLFLMFHKLSNGTPSVFTEYSKDDFDAILRAIQEEDIRVLTLSELDKENEVSETKFVLHAADREQFDIRVSLDRGWKSTTMNRLSNIWQRIIEIRQYAS